MNLRWLPYHLIIPVCILVASCGDDAAPAGDEVTFSVRYENIGSPFDFTASDVVDTPVGATAPAPLLPGESYEFSFVAAPGQRLSFATMFVRSNDYFFSPDEMGIALFDENRNPVNGDVTDQVMIWDAGTELDELQPGGLGAGPNARPQQEGTDVGPADPDATVRLASGYDDLPATSDVLAVQIGSMLVDRAHVFTVSLTNASDPNGPFPTPHSPGVWAVYTQAEGSMDGPFFTSGAPDRGEGLELIAEDGVAGDLAAELAARTGLTAVSSPGVWAVHTAPNPLFDAGTPDRGDGLEAIAEDGDPSALGSALPDQTDIAASGVINTAVGAAMPSPIGPGQAYEFEFTAAPGQFLSVATMFVPSNDILFATGPEGIALFDGSGAPVGGDVTASFELWDVGTEVNQVPGAGLDQVHLQDAVDTGDADADNSVRQLDDGFTYPPVNQVLQVTITPQ